MALEVVEKITLFYTSYKVNTAIASQEHHRYLPNAPIK